MPSLTKPLSASDLHPDSIDVLLKPSWLSGLIIILLSAGVVLGAVITLSYGSSSLQLLSQLHRHTTTPTVSGNYQALDTNFSSNTLISDIPLFVFWAGIGVIAYSFISACTGVLRGAAELEAETHYVNANRHRLLMRAAERLAIRLAALLVWIGYIQITLRFLLPYAIAVSYAGTGNVGRLTGAGYLLWAVVLLVLAGHLHTILIRLLALRPRLFSQTSEA